MRGSIVLYGLSIKLLITFFLLGVSNVCSASPASEASALCDIFNINQPSGWTTPCGWIDPCFATLPGIQCSSSHVTAMYLGLFITVNFAIEL